MESRSDAALGSHLASGWAEGSAAGWAGEWASGTAGKMMELPTVYKVAGFCTAAVLGLAIVGGLRKARQNEDMRARAREHAQEVETAIACVERDQTLVFGATSDTNPML